MARRIRTGLISGRCLECGLDCLALVGIHAAVHHHQAVAAREALSGQDRLQPFLRGTVFA